MPKIPKSPLKTLTIPPKKSPNPLSHPIFPSQEEPQDPPAPPNPLTPNPPKSSKTPKKPLNPSQITMQQPCFLQLTCPQNTQVFCSPRVPSLMVGMRKRQCRSADGYCGKLEGDTWSCPFQGDINYSSGFIYHVVKKWLLKTRSLEKTSFSWYLEQILFMLPAAVIPAD